MNPVNDGKTVTNKGIFVPPNLSGGYTLAVGRKRLLSPSMRSLSEGAPLFMGAVAFWRKRLRKRINALPLQAFAFKVGSNPTSSQH